MGRLISFTTWRESWVSGFVIGGIIWLLYSFGLIFKSLYSNWFINNMNPSFRVTLYSFNYWQYIFLSLFIFALLGFFLGSFGYLLKRLIDKSQSI